MVRSNPGPLVPGERGLRELRRRGEEPEAGAAAASKMILAVLSTFHIQDNIQEQFRKSSHKLTEHRGAARPWASDPTQRLIQHSNALIIFSAKTFQTLKMAMPRIKSAMKAMKSGAQEGHAQHHRAVERDLDVELQRVGELAPQDRLYLVFKP